MKSGTQMLEAHFEGAPITLLRRLLTTLVHSEDKLKSRDTPICCPSYLQVRLKKITQSEVVTET